MIALSSAVSGGKLEEIVGLAASRLSDGAHSVHGLVQV